VTLEAQLLSLPHLLGHTMSCTATEPETHHGKQSGQICLSASPDNAARPQRSALRPVSHASCGQCDAILWIVRAVGRSTIFVILFSQLSPDLHEYREIVRRSLSSMRTELRRTLSCMRCADDVRRTSTWHGDDCGLRGDMGEKLCIIKPLKLNSAYANLYSTFYRMTYHSDSSLLIPALVMGRTPSFAHCAPSAYRDHRDH
jgi:hypothetical protein